MNNGRARETPLRAGRLKEAGLQHPEVLLPEKRAFQVVAVESLGAEKRHHVLAVRRRGRVGVRRFRVALHLGDAFVRRPLPQDLTGVLVQTVDLPLMNDILADRLDVPVEPHFEGGIALGADRRGDEEAIAPDNRRRVGEPRYRRLPKDVLGVLDAPLDRRRVAFRNPLGVITAKTRPVDVVLGEPG